MISKNRSRAIVMLVLVAMVAALVPVLNRAEAAGGTLNYGDVVTGQITNASYYDLWQFTGQKGDRVQILMQGDGQLDPYLGLLDGQSQNVLVEDDDSGGNSDAYIEFSLPATGAYIIVATRFDLDTGTSQGQYRLALSGGTGPQNVSSTTTTASGSGPQEVSPGVFFMGDLPLAESVSGQITNASYAQIYQVQLDAGTDFMVAMFADGSTLDSYIMFADPDGNVLAEDNDSGSQVGGGQKDAFLRLTIPTTGTYLVAATRAGMDTGISSGNYALVAGVPDNSSTTTTGPQQNDVPNGVSSQGAITVDGGALSGTIDNTTFANLYVLDGNAGEQVTITMTGAGNLDSYLGLLNPAGDVIAEDDDSAGGTNAQISIRLPEAGRYTIVATRTGIDQGSTVGNYSLVVSSGTPAAPTVGSNLGGFGGLPGRALQTGADTFYLRGFGRSDNPAKNTPIESFFLSAQESALPGRSMQHGADSFSLSGFGRSDNPAKNTPIEAYLQSKGIVSPRDPSSGLPTGK